MKMSSKKDTKPVRRSLYAITNDINEIYNKIEEADGEITPEIEDELAIRQDEFAEKAEGYANFIKSKKSYITECKEEENRIKNIRKVTENIVERVSSSLAKAIDEFGDTNSSGNHFIETKFMKITSMPSRSMEIDTAILDAIVSSVIDFASTNMREDKMDDLFNDPDEYLVKTTDHVNDDIEDRFDRRVSYEDIALIPVSVTLNVRLVDLLMDQPLLESALASEDSVIKQNASASYIKGLSEEGVEFPFAKRSDKKNLLIK